MKAAILLFLAAPFFAAPCPAAEDNSDNGNAVVTNMNGSTATGTNTPVSSTSSTKESRSVTGGGD